MKKKSVLFVLRLLITSGLILYVLHKAGLFNPEGRQTFIDMIQTVRYRYLLLSLGIGVLLNISSSVKWYMLLNSRMIHVKLWRIFAY